MEVTFKVPKLSYLFPRDFKKKEMEGDGYKEGVCNIFCGKYF